MFIYLIKNFLFLGGRVGWRGVILGMSLVREQLWAQTLIPAHKAKEKQAYAGTLCHSIARINPTLESNPSSGGAVQLLRSHF